MRTSLLIVFVFFYINGYSKSEANPAYNYVEVGYYTIFSDGSSDFDQTGNGFNFSYLFDNNILFSIERVEVEDSFEKPTNITLKGFNIGYVYDINKSSSAYLFGSRKKVEAVDYEDVFDRYYSSKIKSLGIGYSIRVLKDWELNAEARYDMMKYWDGDDENEAGGSAKVTYYLTDRIGFGGSWEYQFKEDVYGLFFKLGF